MKTVIVFYSFKGNSKYAAEKAAELLGAGTYQLVPSEEPPKKGLGMFLKGGSMALRKKDVQIRDLGLELEDGDTVILCAPVWAGLYPPAVGTFLKKYDLKGKRLAVIASSASGDASKLFAALEADAGVPIAAKLSLQNPLRDTAGTDEKIREFIEEL